MELALVAFYRVSLRLCISATKEGIILITFDELGLSEQTLTLLKEVGFSAPTEIQSKTIGIVAQRQDLVASAQTGSGKTAAYVLPILDLLRDVEKTSRAKTRVLVVVPTRELALQVKGEFDRFGKDSGLASVVLYGGTGYRQQVRGLHRGAEIIVATPGRLLDCVNRNFASLAHVQIVVLDEADRLLDMGFMPQVRAVMERVPRNRQTLMFSATIDSRMKKIAEEFLNNPVFVTANSDKIEPSSIEQQFHYIKEVEKEKKLLSLIQESESSSILVFTKTRRKATQVTKRLREQEIQADEIHGDISQSQRVRTLNGFRNGEFNVLVATDVAARGLDIPAITHVINYDLPMLAEDYVHRIGRTGRAGRSGVAHSFISNDQRHLIRAIHEVLKNRGREDEDNATRSGKPVQQRLSREAMDYAARLLSGNSQGPKQERGRSKAGARHQFGNSMGGQSDSRRKPAGSKGRPGEHRQEYGSKPRLGEQRQEYGSKPRQGEHRQEYGSKPRQGEQRQEYGSKPRQDEYRQEYGSKPTQGENQERAPKPKKYAAPWERFSKPSSEFSSETRGGYKAKPKPKSAHGKSKPSSGYSGGKSKSFKSGTSLQSRLKRNRHGR